MRARRFTLSALLPYGWLLALFLFPFLLIAKLSLSDVALSMPPYSPQLRLGQGLGGLHDFVRALDLETYRRLWTDPLYLRSFLSSLKLAAIATAVLLAIGYPMAMGLARASPRARAVLLPAVIIPFWTSFLIRVYAWIGILKPAGVLSAILAKFGLGPVEVLNTNAAVLIGLTYAYLPFMVLPLYAALEKQDQTLIEAAADLGASRLTGFWRVTFPLSLPAVGAGISLCFIPMVGEFVIPDLLGGSDTLMIGKTIWTDFFANRDWPSASAAAIVLLAILILPILAYQRWQARSAEAVL
jgi:putrescine transport system permease protein